MVYKFKEYSVEKKVKLAYYTSDTKQLNLEIILVIADNLHIKAER